MSSISPADSEPDPIRPDAARHPPRAKAAEGGDSGMN